jgi:hypothetical protein
MTRGLPMVFRLPVTQMCGMLTIESPQDHRPIPRGACSSGPEDPSLKVSFMSPSIRN